jgi:nitrate/nitrite transporter NarK
MNAISNLAGFGTTYLLGFIKNATGSYPIAMLPLVALAAAGAVTILLVGRGKNGSKIPEAVVATARQ